MKIGELFVALGFQADNKKLSDFNNNMGAAKVNALAVKAAVIGATFAVLKFTDATLQYAVSLKNFAVQTGLSVMELEKWRFVSEQNDVSGQELISTIKGIQSAQAQIKLGAGNIKPWQLLGISPNEDPFTVLKQLRERVKNLDPALAANVLSQLGVGQNFLNVLKASNLEFDKLNEKFLLTKNETLDLLALNRAFKDIIFSLRGLRNRFVALSSKPLLAILKAVKNVTLFILDLIFKLVDLGNRFTFLKKIILVAAALIAASFFPVTAAVAAVIAIVDDLYTFFQGGESIIGRFVDMFNFEPIIEAVNELMPVLKDLASFLGDVLGPVFSKGLTLAINAAKMAVEGWILLITNAIKLITKFLGFIKPIAVKGIELIKEIPSAINRADPESMKLDRNVKNSQVNNNNNNIAINVNGARSPEATADAVSSELQNQLNKAYFQTPNFGVA